jgi:hypothetical protein
MAVNREGTLHIVQLSRASALPTFDTYHVGFADYASTGGAMKMKEIVGERALRDFLSSIGIQPNVVESALTGLRNERTASILSVALPEEMLLQMGLQGEKRGKEIIELAIRMLKGQGHNVQPIVRDDGTMWFEVDGRMLLSWQHMQDLANGKYSLVGLEKQFGRR